MTRPTLEGVQGIHKFVTSQKCRAEFRLPNGSRQLEATITPDTIIPAEESPPIEGETTIFGKVERVGGVDPKIVVRLSDKEAVSCAVSEALANVVREANRR